jgi:hypothetical protein
MSCFRLPRSLCQHIDGLLRTFWWGSEEGKRRTCWVVWEEMTKPKFLGGLGFRDIEVFNLALLSRQAWRILQEPSSLSARILKAVYFSDVDFLSVGLGSSPSRIWRTIVDGKDVLEQGLIRRIGTGKETFIWCMNWLPRDGMMRLFSCISNTPPERVSDLIDPVMKTWDQQALKMHFIPTYWEQILNTRLTTRRQHDFWAWHYEKNGVFSVKSTYRMLVNNREN